MSSPSDASTSELSQSLNLPPDLFLTAFSHPSWTDTHLDSYERLEFLGDAVLGAVATRLIYDAYPQLPEGDMSAIKSIIVSRDVCEVIAREQGLDTELQRQADVVGENSLGSQLTESRNVLAALVESVIGAVFLHGGFDAANSLVSSWFLPHLDSAANNRVNAKSKLQEWAQARGASVTYEKISHDGLPHEPTFTVTVTLTGDIGSLATGTGTSVKAAEQEAASKLLEEVAHDRP